MLWIRRVVWTGVVVLGVAALGYVLSTQPQSIAEPCKVLFLTGGDTPFWQLTAAGAEAAAQQYGVGLTVKMVQKGHSQQSNILTSIEPDQYTGVALSPRAPDKQMQILRELSAQLALVTFDSDAPGSDRMCYIGTDNYSAGRLAAKLTKEAVPQGGKVVLLVATFEKDNAVLRVQGFREEMQRIAPYESGTDPPAYELLDPLEDGIDRDKARANIAETLAEHPDIAAFVGMFSYHGPALLEVLAGTPVADRPQVIAFDEEQTVLDAVAEGAVFASVVQDPFKYGYDSVRMLAALQSGRTMELPIAGSGSLYLPCEPVTADNVEAFKKRLASRLAK